MEAGSRLKIPAAWCTSFPVSTTRLTTKTGAEGGGERGGEAKGERKRGESRGLEWGNISPDDTLIGVGEGDLGWRGGLGGGGEGEESFAELNCAVSVPCAH